MILRVVAAAAILLLAACSDKGVLEQGDPRTPSDAGIATDVTFERIEIDGKRTYRIIEEVESFATRSHRITSLLAWEGRYVHVGLDDEDRAVWIAGIGISAGNPPKVTYSGVFESFDERSRNATFEDGTVLEFADAVDLPREGEEIVVEIDVARDVVTERIN